MRLLGGKCGSIVLKKRESYMFLVDLGLPLYT